jgi:hypothetical protein
LDTNHIYPGIDARAPQCKPPVYLPYPAGASLPAQSSRSNGESWRCFDQLSALAVISTMWVQGLRTMALLSRTTMTVIALPPQQPRHRLRRIWISWPPLLPPPTALLILRAATATATATTTPPVEADEGGAELVALPHLARCVDVAMCQFQLDVTLLPSSSNKVGKSMPPLLLDCIQREAMGVNGRYRHALAGAASSLARSASAEVGA